MSPLRKKCLYHLFTQKKLIKVAKFHGYSISRFFLRAGQLQGGVILTPPYGLSEGGISWQVRFLEKSSALVNQVDKCAKKVVRGDKLTSALSENLIFRKWYFFNVFSIVFSRKFFSTKRQFDIFYQFLANSRFLLPLNRKKSSKTRIFVLFCLDNLT